MKKVLCLVMAITVMCTGLCGCGRMSDAEVTDNTVDGVIGGTSEYDTAKRGSVSNSTGSTGANLGKSTSGSTKTGNRSGSGYVVSPIKGNSAPMDSSMSGKMNTAR